jgi:hypothetical protein
MTFLLPIMKNDKFLGLQRKRDMIVKIQNYINSNNKKEFILKEWRKKYE